MTANYFLFTLLLFTQVLLGQQQSVSTTNDLFNNQLYLLRVESIRDAIDSFIRDSRSLIQMDTIELRGSYKTNSAIYGGMVDTVHFDRVSKAVVITHNKEILKILLPTEPINRPLEMNVDNYYFSGNQLLGSVIKCTDPGVRMGSCGGLYSAYYNYFINNKSCYLRVDEYIVPTCGCGQSYVPTTATVENWILTIKAYLGE